MSDTARDVITEAIPCNIVYGRPQAADGIIQALTTAGYRILAPDELDGESLEAAAKHLAEIAQAMWDRCETKRIPNSSEIGEGEEEDAATAWCFDKAAASIRSLKGGRNA